MFDIDKLNIYWGDAKNKIFQVEKKESVDQQLLNLEKQILLHPRNAHNLLLPVTDELFVKGTYESLVKQGVIKRDAPEMINAVLPHVNVEKSIIFVKGKFMVGPVALTVTGNSVKQADKFGNINTHFGSQEDLLLTKLRFPNINKFNMDNAISSNGGLISEILSQLLSISVDNVKNPVAELQNINMQTISIVSYLVERGLDEISIVDFINQSIIKEYLKAQKANESLFNKESGNELRKTELIAKILKNLGYNDSALPIIPNDWIFENKGFKKNFDKNQLYVLTYFLELVDQARAYGAFNSTQNSDTKGLKDKQALDEAQVRLDSLYPFGAIPLVPQDTVTRINTNGVIAPFYKYGRESYKIFNPFYAIENSIFGEPLRNLKNNYAEYEKGANKDRIRQAIENDFQLFLIHNFVLDDDFDRLMKGDNSLPRRIFDLKNKMPNNLVLQAFLPMINTAKDSKTGELISNLRLFEKDLQGLDEQAMSVSLEEIALHDPELYKDLVKFLMFQTGLNLSPFNYSKILPVGLESERHNSHDYMYVYQDMIQSGLAEMNERVKTQEQALDLFYKFKLLFDLNNARFLKTYDDTPHVIMKSRIADNFGERTTYIEPFSSREYKLLGNSYQKRYNIAYLGNIKTEDNTDMYFPQEAIETSVDMETPEASEVKQIPIIFQEEQTTGYRNRTIKNASADATIAIAYGLTKEMLNKSSSELYRLRTQKPNDLSIPSAGEKLTYDSVIGQSKKYIPVGADNLNVTSERVKNIVDALNSVNARTLNIAGNGIYTMKGKYTQGQIDDFTYDLLNQVLNSPNLNTKIISIRSGGQTGFDEAGVKAGQKLGLPTTVLAPKGWLFRNINGQDISSESEFKSRFGIKPNAQLDLFADTEDIQIYTTQINPEILTKIMDNNVSEISKNIPITLDKMGQDVIDNFETYFPDYSFLNDNERNLVARLVQSGELTLTCKF